MTEETYDLTYLSLGAGVQSSALLVMSNEGLHGVPRADVCIFSDTQAEPSWVYHMVEALKSYSDIPVEVVSAGDLGEKLLGDDYSDIPSFVAGEKDGRATPGRRQCTHQFKLRPIKARVRELLGLTPKQRPDKRVRALIGISVDEASRMKPSRVQWIENTYPLIDARISRDGCVDLVESRGLPRPQWSACVFCPYLGDLEWIYLREHDPAGFERAARVDAAIRNSGKRSAYLHRTMKPLPQVEFKHQDQKRLDLWDEECEGMCGV